MMSRWYGTVRQRPGRLEDSDDRTRYFSAHSLTLRVGGGFNSCLVWLSILVIDSWESCACKLI